MVFLITDAAAIFFIQTSALRVEPQGVCNIAMDNAYCCALVSRVSSRATCSGMAVCALVISVARP